MLMLMCNKKIIWGQKSLTHALPPELVDLDLDVALGYKYCVVRSTSNLVPLVQSMVMVKHGQPFEDNMVTSDCVTCLQDTHKALICIW